MQTATICLLCSCFIGADVIPPRMSAEEVLTALAKTGASDEQLTAWTKRFKWSRDELVRRLESEKHLLFAKKRGLSAERESTNRQAAMRLQALDRQLRKIDSEISKATAGGFGAAPTGPSISQLESLNAEKSEILKSILRVEQTRDETLANIASESAAKDQEIAEMMELGRKLKHLDLWVPNIEKFHPNQYGYFEYGLVVVAMDSKGLVAVEPRSGRYFLLKGWRIEVPLKSHIYLPYPMVVGKHETVRAPIYDPARLKHIPPAPRTSTVIQELIPGTRQLVVGSGESAELITVPSEVTLENP